MIYAEGELDENSVCRDFRHTTQHDNIIENIRLSFDNKQTYSIIYRLKNERTKSAAQFSPRWYAEPRRSATPWVKNQQRKLRTVSAIQKHHVIIGLSLQDDLKIWHIKPPKALPWAKLDKAFSLYLQTTEKAYKSIVFQPK